MNILVTGANGQLGNELRIVAKGSQDKYIFTDVTEASDESINMLRKLAGEDVCTDTVRLDITDLEAVRKMVSEQEVQVIVNCAAYTNVDKAEENYDLAELLNAKAVENLVDCWCIYRPTMFFFLYLTTNHARKSNKERLLGCTARLNCMVSRQSSALVVSM